MCRSSHQRYSIKIEVLKNFAKFTGKHLCQSLFFNKVAGLRPAWWSLLDDSLVLTFDRTKMFHQWALFLRLINSFMTEGPITQKPAHWWTCFFMIWAPVIKELKINKFMATVVVNSFVTTFLTVLYSFWLTVLGCGFIEFLFQSPVIHLRWGVLRK